MIWYNVKDRPLVKQIASGWETTEDGNNDFMAALQYTISLDQTIHWWIRHCVIEDGVLCVVGDDENEPAGWIVDDVQYWSPIDIPEL